MTTTCLECNMPLRLTKEEALEMSCSGTHFIEDGMTLTPVTGKGLRLGNPSKVIQCEYGKGVEIGNFCDIYKAMIGSYTKIKRFVEIQENVEIGKFCKIMSFVFIPTGIRIGNYVFVGPGTVFTNDKYPSAVGDWEIRYTEVQDNVSIGANCTILPGVKIGKGSCIGAGSVVTRNVDPEAVYYGNPAKRVRWL